jgi:D-sedoheptulose 7-phosphate isomerase
MIRRYYESYIHNLRSTLDEIDFGVVEEIIHTLLAARRQDKQVFIIGNGGSAMTASHFACDLATWPVGHADEQGRRLRASSLTESVARMTAIANDLSYEDVFVEQLKNYLNPGDVVIVISASGNSPNILKAVRYARSKGAKTIGLLGFGGGRAQEILDVSLVISSKNYGIAEDFHLIMEHVITEIIRRVLRGGPQKVVFLDRDGVINVKPPEHRYVTSWEEFRFTAGIVETLRALNRSGYKLVVLTNQSGVGKKLMSETTLNGIHANMVKALSSASVRVEGVFYCPHVEGDNCFCRKPKAGLFFKAQSELSFSIDFEHSYFVGDSPSDVLAGSEVSLKTVFVGTGGVFTGSSKPTHVVKNVSEIVPLLT